MNFGGSKPAGGGLRAGLLQQEEAGRGQRGGTRCKQRRGRGGGRGKLRGETPRFIADPGDEASGGLVLPNSATRSLSHPQLPSPWGLSLPLIKAKRVCYSPPPRCI